ncbi:MAG TPA: endonuclease domain-containing protein [Terriglobia bacterium]|nr:endonuclease domain-containing protein [Terriglobia bacterium]
MSLARARSLRRVATEAEKLMWSKLRNRQLDGWKFCRQMEIGHYIADFVCREKKLIIEIDGGQHADSAADRVRTAYLEAEGYRVVRYWNNDVMTNISGALEALRASLACPSPLPSPRRDEGVKDQERSKSC